eukprot:GFUD01033010.1.p1 GENE.GFUD01033010.1~~GFUD01033010.1.p1  ORF type:complete len:276 (+),score=77.27 GFUD01033010.1:70-897(+)
MSLVQRNFWSRKADALDPAFGIPTDVTFVIEDNAGGCVGKVKAHKMFLAMASPVFRTQFYGSSKDTKDVIPIKETTKEAFDAMIEFIYEIEINWETKSAVDLFYLANMASKYLIEEMGEYVKKISETFPLTMETVVEIAATANEFCQFEETSTALFLHCAKFLKSQLTSVNSCLTFVARYSDTDMMATAVKLVAKLDQLNQQEEQTTEHKGKKCPAGHLLIKVVQESGGHGDGGWRCNSNLYGCTCYPEYEDYETVDRYQCSSCDFDNCEDCFTK